MHKQIPSEISDQVSRACAIIDRHLGPVLQAIHLYGSALDGGLKPRSDIDLLVTVSTHLDETSGQALQQDLLAISALPGENDTLRALEVTVVTCNELVPWRYPPRRELQFGEWLRDDLRAGIYEPPMPDHDLAILITKIRQRGIAVIGPPAVDLFDAVPKADFHAALADTIAQWQDEPDWQGDERNVVLALARIWYSASTGEIASKQRAAEWGLEQLPARHRDVLDLARSAYLGADDRALVARKAETKAFIDYVKMEIKRLLPRQ